MEYYTLANKVKIPALGIGTFKLKKEDTYKTITEAINLGYRLIDTAQSFENESEIARAIKDSDVKREEFFLSTKIWPSYYPDPNAVENSLKRLDTNYIDLMFLNYPCGEIEKGYRTLEKAYSEGKIKAIGLANFDEEDILKVLSFAKIKPHVVQIELHPLCQQKKLRVLLTKENIQIMSLYPLAHGDERLLNNEALNSMSDTYYRTNAQLLVRWQIEHRFVLTPGAHEEDLLEANLNSFNYSLREKDLETIDSLDQNLKFAKNDKSLYDTYLTYKYE